MVRYNSDMQPLPEYVRAARRRVEEKVPLERVKRHWLSISFFVGFIVDNITLNRVDQVFDNLVLLAYVVLAGVSLLILYAAHAGKVREEWRDRLIRFSPMAVQFAFGGLLSGILIFYGRSGSWFSSWPFLLIILAVIVGNETIRKRAQLLLFNVVILFIGLFSYVVLIVPVLLGAMGAFIFVCSGVLALLIMLGYLRLLRRVVPNFIEQNLRMLVFGVGVVFLTFNSLYFANIIPPIPLSLKDIGIYHHVERTNADQYRVSFEKGAWYEFFKDSDTTFHYEDGERVFCFSSVFAPTRLSTEIFHRWEYYDEEHEEWRTHDRLSYRIEGGRDGGFRGFTVIENVDEGKWRCRVETGRKQVLGQDAFTIEFGESREIIFRKK